MANNERKPGESNKQYLNRIKAQKREQRIQEEIDKVKNQEDYGGELNASRLVEFTNTGTISQGTENKKSRKNNHRVNQKSVFGERNFKQNRSLAQRAWNDFTDATHLTSPPKFYDGWNRPLNAEVPLWESAQGQELEKMGETAKGAGELVATGLAFGNPLTASNAMAPLIAGSQAYWIGHGINDGAQRIDNIGEGVKNFVEDPSWQNAGTVVKEVPMLALDVAGALPVAKTVIETSKNAIPVAQQTAQRIAGSVDDAITTATKQAVESGVVGVNELPAQLVARATSTPKVQEPLPNVGWAPSQTTNVRRAGELTEMYYPNRWDVVKEGANPFGVWLQGKFGTPRTDITNPGKGERAAKARALFANRPQYVGNVTLKKPIGVIGDVKDRSALSYNAERMGADGIIYNGFYDNGYNNNQGIFSFVKPNLSPSSGQPARIMWMGPTTGKTTYAKKDLSVVDIDPLTKGTRKEIAKKLGLDFRDPKVSESPEYQQAVVDMVNAWLKDPANHGKTLVASTKHLLDPKYGIEFANEPFMPDFATFVARNQARGFRETPEQLRKWYDSILEIKPDIKIDNRFINDMLTPSSKQFIKVVNEDGTINSKELTKKYRQLLKYINTNITKNSTQSLSKPYQSSTGTTTLKDHIRGVVQTAQEIPVPQGSTRAELVRSALVHDIGKFLTGQDGSVKHARVSADLLKNFGDPEFNRRSIRFAVKHHMYDKNFPIYGMNGKHGKLNYNLIKALQASDVARGMSYDKAALTYPQMFTYEKILPKVKFYEGSLEDQLNNVIRPLLKRQGYPSNKDLFDLNQIQTSMDDFATRHRSVIRGARDPKKEINASPSTIRNAINADLDAILQYGEATPQNRLLTSLTTIPRNPTGSGRRGLFEVYTNSDTQLPYYSHPNRLARYLHISPVKQDALYVSASNDIGNTYGSVERSRSTKGLIGKTTLPFQKMRSNESLPEFYERVNFQLYDGNKIIDSKTPMSTYQLFEEPYRLQTGRSLISDMQKAYEENVGSIVEKIKNPKLKPLSVIPHEHISEINTLLETMGSKPINFQHKSGKWYTGMETLAGDLRHIANRTKIDVNSKFIKDALTDKQLNLFKKVQHNKSDWANDVYIKYIRPSLLKHAKSLYFAERPDFYTRQLTSPYKQYLSPENMLKFMRERGIAPLWEMPNFGKTQLFSTPGTNGWGKKPALRNSTKLGLDPQAIIIGKPGEKVLEFTEEIPIEELKKIAGGRDSGVRHLSETDYPITRKTFEDGGKL